MRLNPRTIVCALALTVFLALQATPTKVACVGNSITYGMRINDRETNSYPAQLARLLGGDYEVGNFGKSGATLLTKGHRPYIEQEEYAAALEFVPDIVVIHLGVNDTDPRNYPDYGDNFVEDYLALISSFRAVNPDVRVIIANLSPLLSKHPRYKSGTREWRDKIRALIPTVASVAGAELIDFGDDLRDHPHLLPDGIHPNAAGAAILAESVRGAITGDYGGLKLPHIYGDGMVLQRYRPLKVKGRANAGDTIAVSIAGNTATAVSDNRGNWSVALPPMREGTGFTMTVADKDTVITFNDVAIGEVWLASGQSNMAFRLGQASTFSEDTTIMADPMLRLFDMKEVAPTDSKEWTDNQKRLTDANKYYKPSSWEESSVKNARKFSAVGWYFGKMLRDSLDVPVGIICNAIGGSPTEAWIDIETLEHKMPEILVDWRTNDYLQPWVKKRATENSGREPYHRHSYEPSYLFAAGIRPLSGFPVAGTIWYQGESNAHNVELHEQLFPMLVESWRKEWQQPAMPFMFVQLSSIDRPSWPTFRDSQRRLAETVPGTAMAVSMDRGDSLDVHPREKRPIGQRLARQALNRVYGMQNVVPEGPRVKAAKVVAPGEIVVSFDYAEGLRTSDGKAPRSFEVGHYDGLYAPADSVVILNDNSIKLINMSIKEPRYVRYGWQPFTRANLVNSEGLPASTFKIKVDEAPEAETGIDAGVSAAFVGVADGCVIRAGGCNFPDNPMAPDSKKKYYDGIYALKPNEDGSISTVKIGVLPHAVAYGCAITTPRGMVVAGGATPSGSLSEAYIINVTDSGAPMLTALPSLPVKADNNAATYCDGKVYLAGGNVDGQPSNALYCLDLNDLEHGWQALAPFPGNPRVQPVMAAGKNAKGHSMLYLWGGFAGKADGREASLETDGLAYDIKKKKWVALNAPLDRNGNEVSTGGGVAVNLPDGRIAVVGGVNKDVFIEALRNQAPDYLSHPVEWYKFNSFILVYDPATESWEIADDTPAAARAGAGAAVAHDGTVLLVGGEIKPRIRTADILKINL